MTRRRKELLCAWGRTFQKWEDNTNKDKTVKTRERRLAAVTQHKGGAACSEKTASSELPRPLTCSLWWCHRVHLLVQRNNRWRSHKQPLGPPCSGRKQTGEKQGMRDGEITVMPGAGRHEPRGRQALSPPPRHLTEATGAQRERWVTSKHELKIKRQTECFSQYFGYMFLFTYTCECKFKCRCRHATVVWMTMNRNLWIQKLNLSI